MSTELNMNETVDTSVVDAVDNKKTESYEQFLSRRSHTMAGMIGFMGSILGSVEVSASTSLEYYDTVPLLKGALRDISVRCLEAQIQMEKEWMEMNSYHDPEYVGNKFSVEKIEKLTTFLMVLKTLVF